MKDYRANVVVVMACLRDSFNRHLAEAIVKLAPPKFSFGQLQISELPLYNQDNDDHPAGGLLSRVPNEMGMKGLGTLDGDTSRA